MKRLSTGNIYAERARTRKVLALLSAVPAGDNSSIADRLATFTEADRATFAAGVRCKPPSEETWRQLVKAVRYRLKIEAVMAHIALEAV